MSILVKRLLLGLAAAIMAIGAATHAMAYVAKIGAQIAASGLPPGLSAELRALWLVDSVSLGGLALLYVAIAVRPTTAARPVLLLLALLPLAEAVVLYGVVGAFVPAHLLVLVSLLVGGAAFGTPASAPIAPIST
jgi:hypothetical protein